MPFLILYLIGEAAHCKIVTNSNKGGSPVNKSMLAGIGIGAGCVRCAVASLNVLDRGPQYAQVVLLHRLKKKTPSSGVP
jgi:hypothetical protein